MGEKKFSWDKLGSANYRDARNTMAPDRPSNGQRVKQAKTIRQLRQRITHVRKQLDLWKGKHEFLGRWYQRQLDALLKKLEELEKSRG